MGLQDVFAAVEARMAEVYATLDPVPPLPLFRVGADKLAMEDAPPRVIWVPGREVIRGPHAQGGDGVRNPRPLRTRHAAVAAHLWAADPAGDDHVGAVEALLGHLVAALNDVAHGAWDAAGGDWGPGQESTTRLGAVYVLDLELQIPLCRELDVYAPVTSLPITPVMLPPA